MGAWGTEIFSDDTACDVQDEYQSYIRDGLTGNEAADAVLETWKDSMDDSYEGPVVWLALAATQLESGGLEDRIKLKALEIIDSGAGLDIWAEHGPDMLAERRVELQKLKARILSC